jgi:hypothetical protein
LQIGSTWGALMQRERIGVRDGGDHDHVDHGRVSCGVRLASGACEAQIEWTGRASGAA